MASQGDLNCTNELVKAIKVMREKREELNCQILEEEEDKANIQKELSILTGRLQKVNESLVRKAQARSEFDKTIQETEKLYEDLMKSVESSQTLPQVPKREAASWHTFGQMGAFKTQKLSILTGRWQKANSENRVHESLVGKAQARNEYDKPIQETEKLYEDTMKSVESSQTLPHVPKRET
ncbi:unnamed protein product, partial [Effrenium voratum]